MSDEMETLRARARELEKANARLRSAQGPGGDHIEAQTTNALLRRELALLGGYADAPASGDAPPESVEQFAALPPARRSHMARRMTRAQRDALLGRNTAETPDGGYL